MLNNPASSPNPDRICDHHPSGPAAPPDDEERRVAALERYAILDTPPEAAFDRIARLAARSLNAPMALVSFVDGERQWSKARHGLDLTQTEREHAFCAQAILRDDVMVVADATADPRFAGNPLVTGKPGIRFYAGAPLTTPSGRRIGTLCVIDTAPRPGLAAEERSILAELAEIVIEQLETRYTTSDVLSEVMMRQETENRLIATENKLRLFIDYAPAAIAILDTTLQYLMASERWLDDYGLFEDDIIGRSYEGVFGPRAADWLPRLERCLDGEVLNGEGDRITLPDGSSEWVRWKLQPWTHADGEAGGVVVFTEFISERLEAERRLRESEERYRVLYNNTPVMLHSIDRNGRLIAVSDYWLEYLGYAREEVIGRKLSDFLTESSRRHAEQTFLPEFFKTGVVRNVGYQFFKKDGSIIDISLSATAERDAEGAVARSRTVLIDVTERNNADRALRQSERQMRLIADSLPILICYLDKAGHIRFANRTFSDWHRCGGREIDGERFDALLTPEMRAVLSPHMAAANRGQDLGFEATLTYPDGKTREVEATFLALRRDDGSVDGFVVMTTDATERKATEAQLQQAQKMEAVGQLTGGLAHDFNNLLAVVLGNLQLLERSIKDDEKAVRRSRAALDATERGAELTKRLLAFSRRQTLEPKTIDINDLVSNMKTLLRRTLGETVELNIVCADGLWLTKADPNQVETAVLNLAINARDAMPDGGRLTIETANKQLDEAYTAQSGDIDAGDYAMVAVSDSGTGIPKALTAKVFQPFFTTKDVGKGSGLGLSMVYGFVKQSGGHIKIYSEEGHGTSVKIYLPRETEEAVNPAWTDRAEQPIKGGDESILVVEDDSAVRNMAVSLLEDLGYRVLEAENGADALAALQRHANIDLMFSDIIMPGGMNGAELAIQARQRHPGLRVLHTSGYAEAAVTRDGKIGSTNELLSKPYRKEELARKVRRVLDQPLS